MLVPFFQYVELQLQKVASPEQFGYIAHAMNEILHTVLSEKSTHLNLSRVLQSNRAILLQIISRMTNLLTSKADLQTQKEVVHKLESSIHLLGFDS